MSRVEVCRRLTGYSLASSGFLLLGLVAFLLGGTPAETRLAGGLRIEPQSVSLGDLPAGARVPVTFTVRNLSGGPVKLLGVEQFCTNWGCLYKATDFPRRIPPHSSGTFSLEVRTRARECRVSSPPKPSCIPTHPGASRQPSGLPAGSSPRRGLENVTRHLELGPSVESLAAETTASRGVNDATRLLVRIQFLFRGFRDPSRTRLPCSRQRRGG